MRKFIWGLFFILSGCTGYQYVASPSYVPVKQVKNEFNVNFSYNYFQFAYNLTDCFSIYTTGSYRYNDGGIIKGTAFSKENGGGYIQTDEHSEIDLGLAYYHNINDFLSFGIVSGVGLGQVDYSNFQDLESNYEFSFNATKFNYYIQPNVTFRFKKYFDISVYSKVSSCNYFNITDSLNLGSKLVPDDYDQYFYNKPSASLYFIEPGLQVRWGWEHVKFHFMCSEVFDLNNTNIQFRHYNMSLGVAIRMGFHKK